MTGVLIRAGLRVVDGSQSWGTSDATLSLLPIRITCGIFIVDTTEVALMRTKVQKWGNSLAVRIPRSFAEQLGVNHNSEIDLVLTPDGLIVKPIPQRYELSTLLAKVTEENLHGEISTGGKVGREEW